MPYYMTCHRDYAASAIKRFERNFCEGADADYFFAEFVVQCGQGASLVRQIAVEIGNETIVSIADTVLDTIKESEAKGCFCYRKITKKQARVLAVALLERYETAREIGAAIWGLTPEEIDEASI
jgi:hypothetical protein